MMRVSIAVAIFASLAMLLADPLATAANEGELVGDCGALLDQFMATPDHAIPESLMHNAVGVAIVPGLIKAGFILGGRHGHGVVLVRQTNGWSNPIFVSLTGGSVGWQVGIQSTDVVLVFKTRKSMNSFLNGGKFTLTADAGLAVGPLGRHAEAGTDAKLSSEIYSYSRTRGLFVGVSLEGADIAVDADANAAYYSRAARPAEIIQSGSMQAPESAQQLRWKLAHYTGIEVGNGR